MKPAQEADDDSRIVAAAEKLVEAITFDDSGAYGRGGNGGLISRDTIRAADELRLLIIAWRRDVKAEAGNG